MQLHPLDPEPLLAIEPVFYLDTIRAVTLLTPNKARLGRFYADVLGLVEHSLEARESVWCSSGPDEAKQGKVVLRLVEDLQARMRPPGTTGLFHTAFLLPNRPALAAAARVLLQWSERDPAVNFQGYAEHGVSEAVYGTDPDGNGIELTLDHPFAKWSHGNHPGDRLDIISRPLSVRDLWRENLVLPVCTAFSHVHLNVSSLAGAERLFVKGRKMQVMQRSYPGALFLAYGDYHHHLAANIWAGAGIVAPPAGTVGLLDVEVHTPTGDEWHLSNADLTRN